MPPVLFLGLWTMAVFQLQWFTESLFVVGNAATILARIGWIVDYLRNLVPMPFDVLLV